MRLVIDGTDKGELIEGLEGIDENDKLSGNGGNDTIIGHWGDDKIWGGDDNDKIWGGRGKDDLWGDSGRDQFRFNIEESADSDTIKDFQDGIKNGEVIDRIGFDWRVYDELSSGISSENFVKSDKAKAKEDDDFILFDTDDNKLFYDADGDGNGDKVLIAKFEDDVKLTLDHLFIFPEQT